MNAPRKTARSVGDWLPSAMSADAEHPQVLTLDQNDLSAFLDTLPVAIMYATDRTCARITGNVAAHSLLRLPLGANFIDSLRDGENRGFRVLQNGVSVSAEDLPLQVAARTGESVPQSEWELRFADGDAIYITSRAMPLKNSKGEVCGSIGAFVDISKRVGDAEHAQFISKEMRHRAKNTLGIVNAIASMTIRQHLDPRDYNVFIDRLTSVGRFQELASFSDDKGIDLAQLCKTVVAPMLGPGEDRIFIGGPQVTVGQALGSTLAMLVHELATNACKHGSLSVQAGHVSIWWDIEQNDGGEQVTLRWMESSGPKVTKPTRQGFGIRLFERLGKQLPGGKALLDYAEDGVVAALTFRP